MNPDNLKLTADILRDYLQHPVNTFVRGSISHLESYHTSIPVNHDLPSIPNLPDEFKGQEIWKDLLSPILSQGECGSCWDY